MSRHLRLRAAPGGDVAALSEAPGSGRSEPRAGFRAVRAAAESKIAEPCPPLDHFHSHRRGSPARHQTPRPEGPALRLRALRAIRAGTSTGPWRSPAKPA